MLRNIDKKAAFKNLISEYDLYSFTQSLHYHVHHFLGTKVYKIQNQNGVLFTFWAPQASSISLIGDFNHWNPNANPMYRFANSNIWTLWIDSLEHGDLYQFLVYDKNNKAELFNDPYAKALKFGSRLASRLCLEQEYIWRDSLWIRKREQVQILNQAFLTMTCDFAQWQNQQINYQELAKYFVNLAKNLGATHLELTNFSESILGFEGDGLDVQNFYFAPSYSFGDNCDFKCFIDYVHQQNLGIILKIPNLNQNISRREIANQFISSLVYWIEEYHVDGFNFGQIATLLSHQTALASDFWIQVNQVIHSRAKGLVTIAEDASGYPNLTKDIEGLGFDLKTNIYWPNEINKFFVSRDEDLSSMDFICSSINLFAENFILDLDKIKLNHNYYKIMLGYFFTIPSKKHFSIIEDEFCGIFSDLAQIYSSYRCFFEIEQSCMEWVHYDKSGLYAYLRWSSDYQQLALVIINLSSSPIRRKSLGVTKSGFYKEIFNSDALKYKGLGQGNADGVYSSHESAHFRPYSLVLDLPQESFLIYLLE